MPKELTQAVIEQWVSLASGTFNVKGIWSEIGIESTEGKHHLRTILNRLVEKGILQRLSSDGSYRKRDNEAQEIDWQGANPSNVVNLKFPFGLEEYVKIYPKSVIIVTGSKNEGKTELLLETVVQNMNTYALDLFNSETGPEQLQERLSTFDIPVPAPFKTYERYDNFADVIDPDKISVIDYLDLNSEVYLVGAEIDAIFRKLRNGVAIIGLQKPPPSVTYVKGVKKLIERDLAYGGGFTAKRAALYISLSSHKLKLLYVKTPANKKINPNNMQWRYDFSEDAHFTNIARWYGDENNEDI